MRSLNEELEINFDLFNNELKDKINNSFDALEGSNNLYIESFKRLSSLEAWKAYVLEKKITNPSLEFYLEAQNDALLSYTFAKIGAWRSALHCLRSLIENVLFCLYYKDHSVEYKLWENGKHQMPISDFVKYISSHPNIATLDENLTGVAALKREYSVLSKAVHASSSSFRMTKIGQQFPAIMQADVIKLNQWITREKAVIQLINQMLLSLYYDDLESTKLRELRKSISFAIPKNLHDQIKSKFNVRLFEIVDS